MSPSHDQDMGGTPGGASLPPVTLLAPVIWRRSPRSITWGGSSRSSGVRPGALSDSVIINLHCAAARPRVDERQRRTSHSAPAWREPLGPCEAVQNTKTTLVEVPESHPGGSWRAARNILSGAPSPARLPSRRGTPAGARVSVQGREPCARPGSTGPRVTEIEQGRGIPHPQVAASSRQAPGPFAPSNASTTGTCASSNLRSNGGDRHEPRRRPAMTFPDLDQGSGCDRTKDLLRGDRVRGSPRHREPTGWRGSRS